MQTAVSFTPGLEVRKGQEEKEDGPGVRSGGQTRGQLLDACRSACPQHTRALPFLPSLPVALSIIEQACLSRGPLWLEFCSLGGAPLRPGTSRVSTAAARRHF